MRVMGVGLGVLMAVVALLLAMVLLCVGVILRKDHSFRSQHIGENERMKRDGIHCATSQDREARKGRKLQIVEKTK